MKQKYFKKIKIGIIIVIVSFLNFLQLEICNQNGLGMPLKYVIMNVGVLICLYLVLYMLFRRLHGVILGVTVVNTILAVANYYVIEFRGTPLSTKDIKNFGTAMTVVSSYDFVIDKRIVVTVGIFLILCVLAWVYRKKAEQKKTEQKKTDRVKWIRDVVLSVGLSGLFLYICFFADWSLKPKNTFGWSWEMAYHEYGFLAESLEILEASVTTVQKPEGYTQEREKQILESVETVETDKDTQELPNIILILNESWFDLETIVDLETEDEITPWIDSTTNAVHGYSLVPMVGTNLSEYEFLTGNSLQLMQGITPFNSLDMTGKESIVSVLKSVGYYTTAMHPAVSTNYSRNVAYPAMGFDEILFQDAFESIELYGDRPHLTDSASYKTLIENYEKHADQGPQLIYMLTIQNHGGWEVNAEELDTVKLENDFGVYREMTEEYLSCLNLTDTAWKELTDYFEQVEQPTIICMVGDHAPSFADTLSKYWSGKSDEELAILLNSTPYIIWSNYELDKEELGDISINYMAAAVLQMAGIECDAYYNYMNELRLQVPVLSSFNLYISSDRNTYQYTDDTEYSSWLDGYFIMEYGRIR